MSYALSTLWYERQRFLPGVLAVAFSCLLIALQCGLLLGLFSITSLPIDETNAHVWVGHPEVPSVDLGRPIPAAWESYLAMPEVKRTELYMQGFAYWDKPTGGSELCVLIGSRLNPEALGAVQVLTPRQRALLTMPGAIIIDEEVGRLVKWAYDRAVSLLTSHRETLESIAHALRLHETLDAKQLRRILEETGSIDAAPAYYR